MVNSLDMLHLFCGINSTFLSIKTSTSSQSLTSSCTCHTVFLCRFSTLIIHNYLTLSLPAHNLPLSQILPTMDSFLPSGLPLWTITRGPLCYELYRLSVFCSLVYVSVFGTVPRLSWLCVSLLTQVKHPTSYHIAMTANVCYCTTYSVHRCRCRNYSCRSTQRCETFVSARSSKSLHILYDC